MISGNGGQREGSVEGTLVKAGKIIEKIHENVRIIAAETPQEWLQLPVYLSVKGITQNDASSCSGVISVQLLVM